jgi:hypothetical protein
MGSDSIDFSCRNETKREQYMNRTRWISILLFTLILTQVSGPAQAADEGWDRDSLSYKVGNFSGFAEVVNIGIKKMALSFSLPSAEMDELERAAIPVAEEREVEIYREPKFLVTDLFPLSATEGKEVLIIYKEESTMDEYNALKEKKAALMNSGKYEGEARREIAWNMGRLLSYPDAKIRALLGD